jgi:tRNA threonylcarbamoyladenosine biosynthesis protein TsaB
VDCVPDEIRTRARDRHKMKALALELSTARGSLAWLSDGGDPIVRQWSNDRKHSGSFFENLVAAQKQFGHPDTIIVGLGPGSYAGVRISISAAIGLQASSHAHLVGFPSICAMECGAKEYCVIGDARRQSFFFARISANELMEGPILFTESEIRDKLDTLDRNMPILASEELSQFERVLVRYPSAAILLQIARDPARRFVLPPLEPMYLREPHITIPRTNLPFRVAS